MGLRRAVAAAVVSTVAVTMATALSAGATSGPLAPTGPPAAGQSQSTGGGAEPVMVVQLTDASGERTPVAVDGLDDLGASDVPVAPEGASSTQPAAWASAARWVSAIVGSADAAIARTASRVAPASDDGVATENIAALTPPMATSDFFVAGVTWAAGEDLPPDARIFIRVLEGETWSEWLETEPEDAATDGADVTEGTDPFVTGGADAFQIQVTGDGAALPPSLRVSLIPDRPASSLEVVTEGAETPETLPEADPVAPVDAASVIGPNVAHPLAANARFVPGTTRTTATSTAAGALGAVLAKPNVLSRSAWGADPALMTWSPTYATLKAAVVHHTAGTNTYTADQSPSIVRSIYYYHAVTRGWGDIGYNFLVDKYGQVFEGRYGSLTAADTTLPVGAHAAGFNTGSLGISAMGDYTQVNAPQLILDRMAEVISWKFSAAGIDPTTTSGFTSPGTAYRPAGQALPRIFAHRDVGATVCPGNDMYGRISGLLSTVTSRLASSQSVSPDVRNVYRWRHTSDGDWISLPQGKISDANLVAYGYVRAPIAQFSADTTPSADGAMVAINRWWNARDRDWVDMAAGSPSDDVLVRWGYSQKAFQFMAYRDPGAGRVALVRWWHPADRDWVTLRDGEIADAQLAAWGYGQRTLLGYVTSAS